MADVTLFVVGSIFGIVLASVLLRRSIEARYAGMLDQWRHDEIKSIRSQAIARSRAALKGRIGEQLAPLLAEFPYAPADARFLGNPIDYVIFDGYTEVKERQADELREIVFLDVKKGPRAALSREELRIRDCIQTARRVRFETLYLNDVPEQDEIA